MFLICPLCQETTVYFTSFCPDCTHIKRLLQVYGKEETLLILNKVCLRNHKQRDHKIVEVKKNLTDSVYEQPANKKSTRPN
jgi:glutaredoxin